MKDKILSVISFVLVGYSMVSIGYTALPVEIKDMIPQLNDLTALLTGGTSGVLGGAGIYFRSLMSKTKTENDEKVNAMAEKIISIGSKYDQLANKYDEMKSIFMEGKQETIELQKLIKADINLKLSNPLIDEKAKEITEGVLNDKA